MFVLPSPSTSTVRTFSLNCTLSTRQGFNGISILLKPRSATPFRSPSVTVGKGDPFSFLIQIHQMNRTLCPPPVQLLVKRKRWAASHVSRRDTRSSCQQNLPSSSLEHSSHLWASSSHVSIWSPHSRSPSRWDCFPLVQRQGDNCHWELRLHTERHVEPSRMSYNCHFALQCNGWLDSVHELLPFITTWEVFQKQCHVPKSVYIFFNCHSLSAVSLLLTSCPLMVHWHKLIPNPHLKFGSCPRSAILDL